MAMLDEAGDQPQLEHDQQRKRKLQELQEQFEKSRKDKPDELSSYKSM